MERNIFEAATNKLRKTPKTDAQVKIPVNPSGNTPQNQPSEQILQDPDISNMVAKMRKMKTDLEVQVAKMYEIGKERNFDVEKFLEKKFNLSPQDLESMLEKGKQLENRFKEKIPPQSGFHERPKSTEALEKERKGKTLGARKKNWISVH